MSLCNKIIIIFWHFPCFGFLSSLLLFTYGQGVYSIKAGKSAGNGLIMVSRFLLNPINSDLIYPSESPFMKEPEWIEHGKLIKIIFLPLSFLFAALLFLQGVLLMITVVGFKLGINISKTSKYILNPELVRYSNKRLYKSYTQNNLK